MRNKTKAKKKISIWIIIVGIIGILFGIWVGMTIQQMIFIQGLTDFGESLEGTSFELNIDLNETIMMDRMIEFLNSTEGEAYQ
ncbi:MAG TPA: hypothetical protein ENH46_02625 [Candidatus Pacearchaeota archaeon]|nr:hypothetical protein [Candidatus Pacearchaeota archaeon]